MPDFYDSPTCVTHHHACDCREAHFRKLEEALRWIKERAGQHSRYLDYSMIEDCAEAALRAGRPSREGGES